MNDLPESAPDNSGDQTAAHELLELQFVEQNETLESIRRGLEDVEVGRTEAAGTVHEKLRKM